MEEKRFSESLIDKVIYSAVGPVLGLLPPPLQIKLAKGDLTGARIMSTSSRIINAAYAAYTLASLTSGLFGIDIDPTPNNMGTTIGVVAGVDTLMRETLYRTKRAFSIMCGDSLESRMSHTEVWGEPLVSAMYSLLGKSKD